MEIGESAPAEAGASQVGNVSKTVGRTVKRLRTIRRAERIDMRSALGTWLVHQAALRSMTELPVILVNSCAMFAAPAA